MMNNDADPAPAGQEDSSVVPRDAAGAAHEPSTHRQPSPAGRWDREMAQHSTSTAPMALRSLDAPTGPLGD